MEYDVEILDNLHTKRRQAEYDREQARQEYDKLEEIYTNKMSTYVHTESMQKTKAESRYVVEEQINYAKLRDAKRKYKQLESDEKIARWDYYHARDIWRVWLWLDTTASELWKEFG